MPRFFVDRESISESKAIVKGDDAFHIARSLRMAVGDEITIADGEGHEYICRLDKIRDEGCECEILERRKGRGEPPVSISLFMAYPKGDKLETVIQKSVELGVSEITPFESSRCIKRPKAEKAEKQLARLARIAKEAAKQCGRSVIPIVYSPLSFEGMLAEAKKSDAVLFCYEGEDRLSLKSALKDVRAGDRVAVIIGSEGGFSVEEANRIVCAGAISVSLGERILRCETAPAFVLSAISYELEL